MISKTVRTGLLALLVAPLVGGCAEERDAINRVQANALDKSFFVGADLKSTVDDPEFYTQATIVDAGYGAGQSYLFNGFAQALARIKFEVTEDLLIGRLSHARIENSDGKGLGPESVDGQIVVAFAIDKHFDIRRAYNPSTGEEMNVIEENTSDRPWYERQYMRVDWSKNLNTDGYDFDTLSVMGLFGGVEFTPLSYYVNDPMDPMAPHFDAEDGYFDITTKVFAKPAQIDLSHLGWGINTFPACFLPDELFGGTWPEGNCNPVEVAIRHSFRRVVDTDYEPAEVDGFKFEAFGAFLVERFGYNRNYGMSDDQWHRLMQRYNPWERSHYYDNPEAMTGAIECYTPDSFQWGDDPHADNDNDGTEDACWGVTVALGRASGLCGANEDAGSCYPKANPVHGGSACDTFKQKCTLPFRHRVTKTLPWYYVSGGNLDYYESTDWSAHDHDTAIRHAISVARYAECMATSKQLIADVTERRNFCLNGDGGPAQPNPVYFGQMDDHHEAKSLSREVDDCRHGKIYPEYGAVNSADREAQCVALADTLAETRRAGGNTIDPGVVALAKMPEAVVLCHSPVEAGDPAACAPAEERLPEGWTQAMCDQAMKDRDQESLATCRQARMVRRGDLRYHWVNVYTEPQTPSPWGYGPVAADPLTGEVVAGNINVWSHVNDLWSQGVIDRIRFIKGELSADDITEAEYIKDWAQAAEAANGSGVAGHMSRQERTRRVAEFFGESPKDIEAMQKMPFSGQDQDKFLRRAIELSDLRADSQAGSTMSPIYEARRKKMIGTDTEAQLITKSMQQYAGVEGLPGDAQIEFASIFQNVNPMRSKQMRNLFQMKLAERGQCFYEAAPAPMAITGLADILESKFANACADPNEEVGGCNRYHGNFGTAGRECADPNDPGSCTDVEYNDQDPVHRQRAQDRAERARVYLATRAHYAVMTHEMGHTIGERHNFVSSSDAWNFRPQYWQLRTNNGQNTNICTDYDETGSCVGPRWYDPLTQHEQDNLVWMWQHSSVMDYAGEYTQDFLGMGAYDFGAARMFYGENVAVYDDANYGGAQVWFKLFTRFGGLLGFRSLDPLGQVFIHYSELQNFYQMIQGCQTVDVSSYRPGAWDEARDGVWDPLLDGFTVRDEAGNLSKCRQQPVDYVQWRDMETFSPVDWLVLRNAIDEDERFRVPYGFGTDRWADIGNAAVFRHDNGADTYEIFNFLASQQELHHIFDNYRRGNQGFSVRSASSRTNGRYNQKIRDGGKALALLKNIFQDMDGIYGESNWLASEYADNVVSATMVFDQFTSNMARPEAGEHYWDASQQVVYSLNDSYGAGGDANPAVIIPNGASGLFGTVVRGGKLMENQLSDQHGEFDSEYTINAGAYYDKVYAPFLLTESEDNFISDSRQDFVDGRYRAISFADLFPEGYRRFLANMLTGDEQVRAPRLVAGVNGPQTDGNNFPVNGIGHISWWGDEPTVCFPADGTTLCGVLDDVYDGFPDTTITNTVPIDPQVGYEQYKFLIAYTLMYLPENNQQTWLNMLQMYRVGQDAEPLFSERLEFRSPSGQRYVAPTFGTEVIFGKTVQKGVSARVLEYANELLVAAYDTTPEDLNGDGQPDTYNLVMTNGEPQVLYDATMGGDALPANCTATDNSGCECHHNRACLRLKYYETVPVYLWQAMRDFEYADPEMKGIFN